ncbi:hypothetical protein P692DRAFT_20842464, partial [Suillus brevipes Sb2]
PTYEQNTLLQIRSPVHTTNACVGPPSDEIVQSIGDISRHSFYLLGHASNPDFTKGVNLLDHYRTPPHFYSTVPLFSSFRLLVELVWVTFPLCLRRVCSQLHPSFTASTYRSVKSFSNFTIIENMQSNDSSKGASKAPTQQQEECRNRRRYALAECESPLFSGSRCIYLI